MGKRKSGIVSNPAGFYPCLECGSLTESQAEFDARWAAALRFQAEAGDDGLAPAPKLYADCRFGVGRQLTLLCIKGEVD